MFGLKDIGNGILISEDIYGKKQGGKELKEGIIGQLDIGKKLLMASFGQKDAGHFTKTKLSENAHQFVRFFYAQF